MTTREVVNIFSIITNALDIDHYAHQREAGVKLRITGEHQMLHHLLAHIAL